MDDQYENVYLIENEDGAQGIVWADDIPQAESMAIAELDDVGRDSTSATVRPIPNHNFLFGED